MLFTERFGDGGPYLGDSRRNRLRSKESAAVRAWLGKGVTCCMAALFLSGPLVVQAQQLELAFDDGRVTLVAQDVSVRHVLDEWSRIGETVVVNADLVSDERLSLQLDGVPERQAIDIVLRSTVGYVAAERQTDTPGLSIFGRILVLASTTQPAANTGSVMDSDSTSPWAVAMSPPPIVPPAEMPPPAQTLEADSEANSSSQSVDGRAPGARPSTAAVMPRFSAFPPNVEELSDGRPEGAVPGSAIPGFPVPTVEPALGASTAEEDVNGRKLNKP